MKRWWLKRKWLVGLVVLVVALLAAGITVPALAAPGIGPFNTYSGVYLDSSTMVRLAAVLGLTPLELGNQLQTGKTLAQIAQERNVPAVAMVEAIIAPYADRLALQVNYGYITQEQAQALLDDIRQSANYLLEQNLSVTQGYNYSYFGHCGGYGIGGSYGSGYGWGVTGPGMMGGLSGYYNNPAPTLGVSGQYWNGGRGCGRW